MNTKLSKTYLMNRNWLGPAFLFALITAFLLLWESPPESFLNNQDAEPPSPSYPTNIMTNSTTRNYREDGSLSSIITTSEARYFQKSTKRKGRKDYADIEDPEIALYDASQPSWNAIAESAKVTDLGQKIALQDNVKLWRPGNREQSSELTTTYMVVEPEQQYAHTNKPVIIQSAYETTQATGMKAYLNEDKIQLLSKVRGTYEPRE